MDIVHNPFRASRSYRANTNAGAIGNEIVIE